MSAQLDLFAAPPAPVAYPVSERRRKYEAEGRKQRPAPECAFCGLTWAQGCEQPHWHTVDRGRIGIDRCWRCWREVCHLCYIRGGAVGGIVLAGTATLCPDCFAIKTPMSDEECAEHFYANNGPAFVRGWMEWRFEAPAGQYNPIHVEAAA